MKLHPAVRFSIATAAVKVRSSRNLTHVKRFLLICFLCACSAALTAVFGPEGWLERWWTSGEEHALRLCSRSPSSLASSCSGSTTGCPAREMWSCRFVSSEFWCTSVNAIGWETKTAQFSSVLVSSVYKYVNSSGLLWAELIVLLSCFPSSAEMKTWLSLVYFTQAGCRCNIIH